MQVFINTKRRFRRWLLRSLQPCQEMVPLMSESLERRLSVFELAKLKLHLMVCAWCAHYLKQIKFVRSLLQERPTTSNDATSSPALTPEARRRIAESFCRTDSV